MKRRHHKRCVVAAQLRRLRRTWLFDLESHPPGFYTTGRLNRTMPELQNFPNATSQAFEKLVDAAHRLDDFRSRYPSYETFKDALIKAFPPKDPT